MIVDAHLHLFERQSAEYPRGVHPLYPPELRSPAEQFLEVMDRHRIDHAVVVPLDNHDQYLAVVLDRFPDRFCGVGVFDDADPDPVAWAGGTAPRPWPRGAAARSTGAGRCRAGP